MPARLFRPDGPGPFRLAIINHGSDEDRTARAKMAFPEFPALTEWLVGQGFAVLIPERPGHGDAKGPYLESQGSCQFPDYAKAGLGTAQSITAAIAFMVRQDGIRPNGVLVVGNSAGGWGAIALASQQPPALAAVVNFSGGRGGRNHNQADNNCAPGRLIAAAASFGKASRVPELWLYAQNDSYFPPRLSQQMADAFAASGAPIDYRLLPAVRGDGHALIQTSGKEASWKPVLDAFLRRVYGKSQEAALSVTSFKGL